MFRIPGKKSYATIGVCLASIVCTASLSDEQTRRAPGFYSEHNRFDFTEADEILQADIANDVLPFAEVAVFDRDERVYYARAGYTNKHQGEELKPASLYRIASLSKALTSFAALRLVESGALGLDDPVAKYLPAFENLKVQTPCPDASANESNAGPCVKPAKRTMTVRHLMAHTAGISYPLIGLDDVADAYANACMTNGAIETPYSLAELPEKIAALPLANEPGDGWRYGLATDVLGRVIEIATGMPLTAILEEQVFAPLEMNDTHFAISVEDRPRLVPVFQKSDSDGLAVVSSGRVVAGPYVFSTTYPLENGDRYTSAGGGLTSSSEDLSQFAKMLAQGGVHDGVRLLDETLFEEFGKDQTIPFGTGIPGIGFGLGIGVRLSQSDHERPDDSGELFWSGIFLTTFWADPETGSSGVFLSQMRPDQRSDTASRLKRAIMEALAD